MLKDPLAPKFHPDFANFKSEEQGMRRQIAFYRYLMDEKLKELDHAIHVRDKSGYDIAHNQLKTLEKMHSALKSAIPPWTEQAGSPQ